MDYYFAVCEGNTELYSILARVTNVVPVATINTALTYYSTEDIKTSFFDLIMDNLLIIIAVFVIVLLIILILLLLNIRVQKKVVAEEHLVKALNKKAYVDALTSVRNKGAFTDYLDKLQERIDNGEQMELAIGIFDCNNLKTINDQYGHDKGDIYLKTACQLICKIFDQSPVFRIGGDEFAVILQNGDFDNRGELVEQFEQGRRMTNSSVVNKWEEIHIALGIAEFDLQNDGTLSNTVRRADRVMYENKRLSKKQSNKE